MAEGASLQTNDQRPPDFFLIGVPRAATSSLFRALGEHPQIFVPSLKEACFTCPDVDPHSRHRTPTRFLTSRDEYLALFAAARADQIVGEGCTYNIYSPAAPALIRALNPAARFLVQLRDPVEQLYSNHGHKVLMGDLGADLEQTLDRQLAARSARTDRPLSMGGYDLIDKASVSDGLARFIAEYGRERVHITLYEEFAAQPEMVISGVLRFLGVDATNPPRPRVEVPHRTARWAGLNRTMASPGVIGRVKALTPAPLHPVARRLAQMVFSTNRRSAARPAMPPRLRARLRVEFRPEVDRLSNLVDRDLVDFWWAREPAAEA